MIVAKFGGSSLADARQIEKVFGIVSDNPARKIIVVSAPGKRTKQDVKITDLLIKSAENVIQKGNPGAELDTVISRYAEIIEDLGLREDTIAAIEADLRSRAATYNGANKPEFMDLMKAAGEDNCAKMIARFFQARGVEAVYANPAQWGMVLSDEYGDAQVLEESYSNLAQLADCPGVVVFPGFFGRTRSGNVITFSRGGSDVTGSILAAAVDAELYENFTDVSSVYAVDPSIVKNPVPISELTYREMRELSYAGFKVYHEDALIPIFNKKIPVRIKNTNDPTAPGTAILPSREPGERPVTGIAAAEGFMCIDVSKLLMNREIGFGRKLLQILEDEGIPFEHMPSGIDNISVVIKEFFVSPSQEEEIIRRIQAELETDEVRVRHDLAMVMLVGEGMLKTVGTTSRAGAALAQAGINIEIINQGASEVNIMFGIDSKDIAGAVRAMYGEFF